MNKLFVWGKSLDIYGSMEKRIKITSFRKDASTKEYTDYILEKLAAEHAVQRNY